MDEKDQQPKQQEDFVQEPLAEISSEKDLVVQAEPQSPSLIRFFLLVVIVSAAVSVLVVRSTPIDTPEPENKEDTKPYLTWFTEERAVQPFNEQWNKSRVIDFKQLVQFGREIEKQIDEESNPRYEALQTKHERRLALMKTFFGDNDVIGVEIPYEQLKNANQLLDSNQLIVDIYKQPRDLADGGLADFEFSLALAVDPAVVREHIFVKVQKGVDIEALTAQNVKLLFSAVDAESNESSKMVRPMKVASRRSNPAITTRNEWVRYRNDTARLFVELEGAMLGDGSNGHAAIKGFVFR